MIRDDAGRELAFLQRRVQVVERWLDLLAETAEMADVQELLSQVAYLAVDVVPGCDLASITVIRGGSPTTVASSDERGVRVDETQYAVGEGPCLQAARTSRQVRHDNTGPAWLSEVTDESFRHGQVEPPWRRVAREAGITAILSTPIASSADIAAGVNIYSLSSTGWTQEALDVAEYLADYAGSALTVAYRLNRTQRLRKPTGP